MDQDFHGARIKRHRSPESIIFHEALHGFTGDGDYDSRLGGLVPAIYGSGTQKISVYIKTNVLASCPSFKAAK
jgi:hypothetical protein